MASRIRMLHADPNSIMHVPVRCILETEFDLVDQVEELDAAWASAAEHQPDLVVMETNFEGVCATRAIQGIKEAAPNARVVVLAGHSDERRVIAAVQAGASAHVSKEDRSEALIRACRLAVEGGCYLPAAVVKRVIEVLKTSPARKGDGLDWLTGTQRTILMEYARGGSYASVAARVGRQPTTIRNNIYKIKAKLRINTTQELVVWASLNGLLVDC